MGFRGALKQGGGFLNNCDGEWQSYVFTTEAPGNGKNKSDEWVYVVPSILVDGATDPVTQHFFLGGADRYTISDDGQSLEAADGGNVTIGANTPAGKLFDSILEAAPELESELPDLEAGEALVLTAFNERRMRFKQQVDEEGTKKRGKRKDKKTGKEWPRTDTIVIAVYDGEQPSTSAKKGSAKPAAKKAGKQDNAIRDKADAAVTDLCKAAQSKTNPQGTIPTSKLKIGALRLLSGDTDKTKVADLVGTKGYLEDGAERDVFAYDVDEGTVQLAG